MLRGRRPASEPLPPDGLRAAALRLLGRREFTRVELTSRLADRGYRLTDVEPVVDRLVADRSVDDRRTALAHLRTSSRIKGRGRLRIQRELEARGLSKSLVQEVLAELSPDEDLDAIRRFVAKRPLPARPSSAERRRLFGQLMRRGFSADAIAKVLRTRPDEE